jgi:hypothetical protein
VVIFVWDKPRQRDAEERHGGDRHGNNNDESIHFSAPSRANRHRQAKLDGKSAPLST